jgi:hypothetical protein
MIGIPAWRCGSSRCTGSAELRCQNAPRPHKIDSRAICQKIILIQSDSAPSDPESVISATAAPVIKALITLAVGIGYCGSLWFGGLGPELLRRTRRSSWNRKGRRFDLPGQQRKRGGKAKHPELFFENIAILVGRDREGATFDAVLTRIDRASIAEALDGVVTPANPFVLDGRKGHPRLRPQDEIPVNVVPVPGKPTPRCPTSISTTSTHITDGSRNVCAASTAGPPRTCLTISDETSPRGMERPSHSAKLDPRRPRKRTESAAHAIRAVINLRLTKKTLPP